MMSSRLTGADQETGCDRTNRSRLTLLVVTLFI